MQIWTNQVSKRSFNLCRLLHQVVMNGADLITNIDCAGECIFTLCCQTWQVGPFIHYSDEMKIDFHLRWRWCELCIEVVDKNHLVSLCSLDTNSGITIKVVIHDIVTAPKPCLLWSDPGIAVFAEKLYGFDTEPAVSWYLRSVALFCRYKHWSMIVDGQLWVRSIRSRYEAWYESAW